MFYVVNVIARLVLVGDVFHSLIASIQTNVRMLSKIINKAAYGKFYMEYVAIRVIKKCFTL